MGNVWELKRELGHRCPSERVMPVMPYTFIVRYSGEYLKVKVFMEEAHALALPSTMLKAITTAHRSPAIDNTLITFAS